MKLVELAKQVAITRDPKQSHKLAERLRFKYGMTYTEQAAWMRTKTDMNADDFEELMQEIG